MASSESVNREPVKTQHEAVLIRLRGMIIAGRFAPRAKLQEVALAEELGVSRTPVRLALQALAQEGLLIYSPQRGFAVRGFTMKEIADAIDVRGRLEAMACRAVAGRGLTAATRQRLETNLQDTEALVRLPGFAAADVDAWARLNGEFHHIFVTEAGNQMIARCIRQIDAIPLAGAGMIATTMDNVQLIFEYVRDALTMHRWVVDAVCGGDGARAEVLMIEHVYQGGERLRRDVLERAQHRAEPAWAQLRLVEE